MTTSVVGIEAARQRLHCVGYHSSQLVVLLVEHLTARAAVDRPGRAHMILDLKLVHMVSKSVKQNYGFLENIFSGLEVS